MRLRKEILNVVESPLVQIATVAESMPGSLKLCYGESDMPTPEFICRAGYEAALAGHTFYTHTAGSPELREAIARKVFELQRVTYRPSEVMGTVGGTMAINIAIRALVGRGDNAVIVSPAYAIYANSVIMSGGEPRPVPLARHDRRFRLDLDRLERAIDRDTRLLVVNSPSNPTGWMITEAEQHALAAIADRNDVVILSDEVYERLAFDMQIAPSLARVIENHDRLIVVNSFSKTYNMTGWRLGWAQSSEVVIRQLYKAAEFITSNPTPSSSKPASPRSVMVRATFETCATTTHDDELRYRMRWDLFPVSRCRRRRAPSTRFPTLTVSTIPLRSRRSCSGRPASRSRLGSRSENRARDM
ncbi:MAG: pyridoxal phosphate-dependent aminotransferase [Vicinamibacterales bacterium]